MLQGDLRQDQRATYFSYRSCCARSPWGPQDLQWVETQGGRVLAENQREPSLGYHVLLGALGARPHGGVISMDSRGQVPGG